MINIIEMIDDLNELEQDVLEEIDPDLVSYTFSTRGGDQLIYLNKVYQIKKKLTTADGNNRTNNHQEGNNNRLSYRITPSIAGNLWTFLKSLMKQQICQSRSLFQFQHGG